jgi:hypothetical protein
MADSSWDNGGNAPASQGMATWAKFGLGCGVALILVTATCVGSCVYLGKQVKKDPKKFEQSMLGFVKQFIQEDWEDFRLAVDQLSTDEGSKALYLSAPGLHEDFPTEEAFLAAARKWRPALEPLPKDIPDLDSHDLSYHSQFGGKIVLSMKLKNGTRVLLTWDGKRRKGIPRASQLVGIEVHS